MNICVDCNFCEYNGSQILKKLERASNFLFTLAVSKWERFKTSFSSGSAFDPSYFCAFRQNRSDYRIV